MDYEVTAEDYGYTHENDMPDLKSAKEFLEDVVEIICETGDVEALDCKLDELCHILDVKFEHKDFKIQPKEVTMEKENAKHSADIKELVVALAKAQKDIKPARVDGYNPHFKSKYASFASCMKACKEPLADNDIVVTQYCETIDEQLTLVTMLIHTSGQWMKSEFPVISARKDSQAIGSALSYAKRYGLCGMVGIVVAGEDDDGNAAVELETISDAQYQELELAIGDNIAMRKNMLAYMKTKYNVDTLLDMPVEMYKAALSRAQEAKLSQEIA